ncbi:hypothetical protein OpiT1DRAFT_04844 [Opitutaceae bacterium TAV1]|nr:hypothetical protein OpiT1DRAFT_04844 [Opitutaceae bacterium TAV1]
MLEAAQLILRYVDGVIIRYRDRFHNLLASA